MVYQSQEDDCGKACVRNILLLKHNPSASKTLPLREKDDTFLSMKKELSFFGEEAKGYEVNFLLDVQKDCFPLIAQVKRDDKLHFLIVKERRKGKVFLLDPGFGEFSLSEKEFAEEFTGKVLTLLPKREGSKKKEKTLPFLRKDETLSYFLLLVLSSLVLALFFFGLSKEGAFLSSLVLLLTSLLLLLFQNVLNHVTRKRMTKEILLPYLKSSANEKDYPVLSRLLDRKVKIASDLVSYGTLFLLLSFFLLRNGGIGIPLFLLSFFLPLSRCFLDPVLTKRKYLSSRKENRAMAELKTGEDPSDSLLSSVKEAGRYEETFLSPVILIIGIGSFLLLLALFLEKEHPLSPFLDGFFAFALLADTQLRLLSLKGTEEEVVSLENGLSLPLSFFSFEKDGKLGYNKNNNLGGLGENGKEARSGLPGQNPPEEKSR
jgi:predicted double-glycine peptidase